VFDLRRTAFFILTLLMGSACSSVSIDAARQLSVTGRNLTVQARQNIYASDDEYLRARDSEAALHGFSGTTSLPDYQKILRSYDSIHQEMAQRAVVFEKLADLYDAFGELSGLDTGAQTEAALENLAGAVQEYAKLTKQSPPVSSDVTAVISKIGGIIAGEIQKAKIKEASIQIRVKVDTFSKLLENPLVREQIVGFRSVLISDVKTALNKLWDAGVYDPKPLLDEIGATAGLAAQKDAAQILKTNDSIRKALGEVIDKRIAVKIDLVEKGYDTSVGALKHLIVEHKKLEEGSPIDFTRLRGIVAQLRGITILLTKAKIGETTAH
jgi:hypothetical protein